MLFVYNTKPMPRYSRRTTRKSYRRPRRKAASFRRRRFVRRSRVAPLQPIARKQIVKMRYDDWVVIDPSTVATTCFFRANSIYDPNLSGVGHQPLPHDLWQSLYNHYTVLGSKISVQAWSEDSATNYMCEVGCMVTDDTTVNQPLLTLKEQPGTTSRLMRCRPDGRNSMVTLYKGFSAYKWFGLSKSALGACDSVSALFGANPTDGAFFCIYAAHPNENTDVPVVNLRVRIEYLVEVSEPKEIAQS